MNTNWVSDVQINRTESETHVLLPTKLRGEFIDALKSVPQLTLGKGREKCVIEFTDQAFTGTTGYKEPART